MPAFRALVRPTPRSTQLWGKIAIQWTIYLDILMAALALFQIPFAIAIAFLWEAPSMLTFMLPSPIVSAAISLGSLYYATRRYLSPTFSITLAFVQFCGWAGSLIFIGFYNIYFGVYGVGEDAPDWGDRAIEGNRVIMWFQVVPCLSLVLLYVPYIVFCCMGVHHERMMKRHRTHQSANINLEDTSSSIGKPSTETV